MKITWECEAKLLWKILYDKRRNRSLKTNINSQTKGRRRKKLKQTNFCSWRVFWFALAFANENNFDLICFALITFCIPSFYSLYRHFDFVSNWIYSFSYFIISSVWTGFPCFRFFLFNSVDNVENYEKPFSHWKSHLAIQRCMFAYTHT